MTPVIFFLPSTDPLGGIPTPAGEGGGLVGDSGSGRTSGGNAKKAGAPIRGGRRLLFLNSAEMCFFGSKSTFCMPSRYVMWVPIGDPRPLERERKPWGGPPCACVCVCLCVFLSVRNAFSWNAQRNQWGE